jgi:hypothetical protein
MGPPMKSKNIAVNAAKTVSDFMAFFLQYFQNRWQSSCSASGIPLKIETMRHASHSMAALFSIP